MPGNRPHYGRWPQHDFPPFKKLRPQSVTSRIQPGRDVIVCAEMDEQWGYVGAKSRQRWLFYAYDRLRKTVVAHVFGERTMATLGRLMSLLSPFDVVILKWFTEFGHLNRGDMLTSEQHRSHNEKRNFSAEFKRESAQLVVDQNYTVADAASAMDVGLSTMTRWVKQLRDERQGKTPKASPITPEQIEIRELRKKLQRIEMENEILKKATALLMSDSLNSSR